MDVNILEQSLGSKWNFSLSLGGMKAAWGKTTPVFSQNSDSQVFYKS